MIFPNVVPGHVDGWSQIRTEFYNELLANQTELLSALKSTYTQLKLCIEADGATEAGYLALTQAEQAIAKAEGKV